MLFNSHIFLVFLVATLAGYLTASRLDFRLAKLWLVAASLFFYGWWELSYVFLLTGSIAVNYLAALFIRRARSRVLLAGGIAFNLGLLGYYKYAGFLTEAVNAAAGTGFPVPHIVLPLAISFFTFQQIAFLVDAARGEAENYRLVDYLLFVTFFPQLIAGPIVHHKEMLPQFTQHQRRLARNLSIGLTIFAIGLFKKVVLADEIAPYSDALFGAVEGGYVPTMREAWIGALAYTLQIYFDFSGYSDMAVGLARLFGIRLPVNFFSPYRAASIIDFWRRWHITLSRFLRDYLYIPLGGNRKGDMRRHTNLLITMLLGGLWHGAGWTFVIWGGLHGVYLVCNHLWRQWRGAGKGASSFLPSWAGLWAGRLVTLFFVVIAWVFFRAASLDSALTVLAAAFGQGERGALAPIDMLDSSRPLSLIAAGFAVCWFLPNTVQWMRRYHPVIDPSAVTRWDKGVLKVHWRASLGWALFTALIGFAALLHLSRVSPFLYFQF